MNPAMIGRRGQYLSSKHSGRHFKLPLKTLGYEIEGEALDKAFARLKAFVIRKQRFPMRI